MENQELCFIPTNSISDTIWYISEDSKENQRLIVDIPTEHPNVWQISKVERVNVRGRTKLTLYQHEFDPHRDYIEKDEDGNIIGMWADFYSSSIPPQDAVYEIPKDEEEIVDEIVTCKLSTTDNIIKIGGGYKTVTASFYDKDEINISNNFEITKENWHCYIDDVDVTESLVKFIEQTNSTMIKIKFTGDKTYLRKVLKVTLEIDDVVGEAELEIRAL